MPSKLGNIETRRQQDRCFRYLTQASTVTALAISSKQTIAKTKLELMKEIMIPVRYDLES